MVAKIIAFFEILFKGFGVLFSGITLFRSRNKAKSGKKSSSRKHKTGCSIIDDDTGKTVIQNIGEVFTVHWYIKNTGNYTWAGWYIQKCVETDGLIPLQPTYAVPQTAPGEITEVTATFIAQMPGEYTTFWKIYDADNKEILEQDMYLKSRIRIS